MANSHPWAFWLIPIGTVVLLRCGGATRSDGPEDGGTTTGSMGSATTGFGTSLTATSGTGGTAGGATTTSSVVTGIITSGSSTTTGSTTTGGGGSWSSDICGLPMVPGPCDAAVPAWWHDPATGVCVPFTYGGCQGNANNFPSLEACQMACSGGQPDMDACSGPGDCVPLGPTCCPPCDPASRRSFVAVNHEFASAYARAHGCSVPLSCVACPDIPEPTTNRQYFIATCEMGHCRVTDVRETVATACMTSMDCMLRDGAECCERCTATASFRSTAT